MGPWTAVAGDCLKSFKNQQNERVGTLRFSLWKPSPFGLWFFSFKSWWLAGAGFVARGRHLMVPELSSGAPGSPYAAMHLSTKSHSRFLLDSGPGGTLARVGGAQCVSSQSEVICDCFYTHWVPPHSQKSRGRISWSGRRKSFTDVYGTLDGGRGRCREML